MPVVFMTNPELRELARSGGHFQELFKLFRNHFLQDSNFCLIELFIFGVPLIVEASAITDPSSSCAH